MSAQNLFEVGGPLRRSRYAVRIKPLLVVVMYSTHKNDLYDFGKSNLHNHGHAAFIKTMKNFKEDSRSPCNLSSKYSTVF